MNGVDSAALIRITPRGPWRTGVGARERTDRVFHSDSLYSAVCAAMEQLGWLDDWLDATARSETPAVRLSSLFPLVDDVPLAPAPASAWPPPGLSTLRGAGARFLPVDLVVRLAHGESWSPDQWEADGESECLVRRGWLGENGVPFRTAVRSRAAVDRLDSGVMDIHRTACVEFGAKTGLWCLAQFDEPASHWTERLRACFRLLADGGVGGNRSIGWGSFSLDSFEKGSTQELLGGEWATKGEAGETGYWLLSMYSPAAEDGMDWNRGAYDVASRGGRVESRAGWGSLKKTVPMVSEGSIVLTTRPPVGSAVDVASEGWAHPVYRAGFAVSIPLPFRVNV